MSWIGGRSLIK